MQFDQNVVRIKSEIFEAREGLEMTFNTVKLKAWVKSAS